MIYELTQKTILSIDTCGNTTVLSTTSSIVPISTQIIRDSIVITQSQKNYNYLTLGKYSHIQLNHATPITVKFGETIVKTRTHKTQLNRFDRMKPILENFSVGEEIAVSWDSSTNTIEFTKS